MPSLDSLPQSTPATARLCPTNRRFASRRPCTRRFLPSAAPDASPNGLPSFHCFVCANRHTRKTISLRLPQRLAPPLRSVLAVLPASSPTCPPPPRDLLPRQRPRPTSPADPRSTILDTASPCCTYAAALTCTVSNRRTYAALTTDSQPLRRERYRRCNANPPLPRRRCRRRHCHSPVKDTINLMETEAKIFGRFLDVVRHSKLEAQLCIAGG